jgi:hypothetical protein
VLHKNHLAHSSTRRFFEIDDVHIPVDHSVARQNFISRSKLYFIIINQLLRSRFLCRLLRIHKPQNVGFEVPIFPDNQIRSLRGYFQTYFYIAKLREIFPDYQLYSEENFSSDFKQIRNEMSKVRPVVLHIRLSDYLNHKNSFGNLSIEYFKNCLRLIEGVNRSSPIWVFSDDVAMAQEFLEPLDVDYFFHSPLSSIETLLTMAQGSAIILSNSSFSWWAATLSSEKTRIIAPSKWFKGLDDPNLLINPNWEQMTSKW